MQTNAKHKHRLCGEIPFHANGCYLIPINEVVCAGQRKITGTEKAYESLFTF